MNPSVCQPARPRPNPTTDEQLETELLVGDPILGWRAWRVVRRHGLVVLESVYHRVHWPYRQRLVAHCMGANGSRRWRQDLPHSSPAPLYREVHTGRLVNPCGGQACGIYAVTSRDDSSLKSCRLSAAGTNLGACVGPVKLWGQVIPYERGYRAQFAYPADGLEYVPAEGLRDDPWEIAIELERAYGISIDVQSALAA